MVAPLVIDDALLRFIPAAPLVAALTLGLAASLRRPLAPRVVAIFSCTAAFVPFVLSTIAFSRLVLATDGAASRDHVVLVDTLYSWVGAGVGSTAFSADLAFQFDSLTAATCLVVTLTGALVQVYSVGYLARVGRGAGGAARYSCYLCLLSAAMLVLLLADNLLLLFLGWQGVGVCSFLLVSFWYGDGADARAGGAVFFVDRIGDAGVAVGTLLLFWSLAEVGAPAVSFRGVEAGFGAIAAATVLRPGFLGPGDIARPTLIGLCFLVAVVAKTSRLPLHPWPPASAVGSIPALAALYPGCGIVAALYLVARLSFVFEAAPGASAAMAGIGVGTALLAASLACVEKDVRKILSYAAVSQAGLMLLAAGVGSYGLAIFHLALQAFFLTLLFLAIGAVVVALDGECDLASMGGLRKRLPRVWWMVVVGVATLAGTPPLSAFFSTEEIHRAVLAADVPARSFLYLGALVAAGLSSFFASRLLILVFHGNARVRRRQAEVRAPGDLMLWPLYVLAAPALLGGLIGLPQFFGDLLNVEGSDSFGNFIARTLPASIAPPGSSSPALLSMLATLMCSASGFGSAYLLYIARPELGSWLSRSPLRSLVARGSFVRGISDFVFVRGPESFSLRVLYRRLEIGVFGAGGSFGSAALVQGLASHGFKHLHSGVAQRALIFAAACTVLALLYLVGWF